MICVEAVSLRLGEAIVLDHVSLTVQKGGITALIGPNGAGKSTLFSLVARLVPLQQGSISIDGLPVSTTSSRQLAKIVAILRQEPTIASRLTVRELVSFGRFPHSRGHLTASDHDAIAESLRLFELQELSERFLETLSGGQRQRALVAMTFCQETDYLLLDEPLNNLDMYHARELMRSLRRIADDKGRTIVIVVHDINHAGTYADRLIGMKQGRIIADGAPHEIITTKALRQIFGYDIPVQMIDEKPVALHFRS